MTYEEAREIVFKFWNGISVPVDDFCEALGIVNEDDYTNIQNDAKCNEVICD